MKPSAVRADKTKLAPLIGRPGRRCRPGGLCSAAPTWTTGSLWCGGRAWHSGPHLSRRGACGLWAGRAGCVAGVLAGWPGSGLGRWRGGGARVRAAFCEVRGATLASLYDRTVLLPFGSDVAALVPLERPDRWVVAPRSRRSWATGQSGGCGRSFPRASRDIPWRGRRAGAKLHAHAPVTRDLAVSRGPARRAAQG